MGRGTLALLPMLVACGWAQLATPPLTASQVMCSKATRTTELRIPLSLPPCFADLVIERGERVAIIGPNGGLRAVPSAACRHPRRCCGDSICRLQCRPLQLVARMHLQTLTSCWPSALFLPGAGKSTLLRLLMGREKPQEGTGGLNLSGQAG